MQNKQEIEDNYLLNNAFYKTILDDETVNANIVIATYPTKAGAFDVSVQQNTDKLELITNLELHKHLIKLFTDQYSLLLASTIDNDKIDKHELFYHLIQDNEAINTDSFNDINIDEDEYDEYGDDCQEGE